MGGTPLGDWGEAVAARHLEQTGWVILERKFRAGRKEIDLVARRGGVVAFVEVKTRGDGSLTHPLEAIDRRKQDDVREVAEAWIRQNGGTEHTFRFDAVAVRRVRDGLPEVEHLEEAWGY
jgi:putative endonuclease